MSGTPPVVLGLIQLASCLVAGTLLAWLFRRANCPGGRASAGLIAGVVAGLLLGPGVGGTLWPQAYTAVFRGGIAESSALQAENDRIRIERKALEASKVSPAAIEEFDRIDTADRRRPLENALTDARRAHRTNLNMVVAAIGGVHAALMLGACLARSGRTWRRAGERLIDARWRDPLRGVRAFVIGAALPGLVAWWLLRDMKLALGIAAAFGAPALAGSGRSPGLFLYSASGLSLGIAVAIIGVWTWPSTIATGLSFLGVMLAVGSDADRAATRRRRAFVRRLSTGISLPALAALTTVVIDVPLVAQTSVFAWTAALALLWSSDGRWIAGKVAGLSWSASGRVVSGGASTVQLLGALAVQWAGGPESVTAALLLGCITIELTGGLRSRLSWEMDRPADEAQA